MAESSSSSQSSSSRTPAASSPAPTSDDPASTVSRINARIIGICVAAAQWVANFFISTTFPSFSSISLTFAYGFYAFFALLSLIFVFFRVPETKGKELEEMEDLTV